MLQITIACVGKNKETYLKDGIQEFSKRLSGYCQLHWIEVADEKTPESASPKEEAQIRDKEGERLLARLPARAYRIALTPEGKRFTSEAMAARIAALETGGHSHLVFLIGGSLGLSERCKAEANEQWSFSDLTFPHLLMRLILMEQIYRSFRINRNEPYHK